jgi:hypothetical protein
VTLSQAEARRESMRCLRCDLEFTRDQKEKQMIAADGRQRA